MHRNPDEEFRRKQRLTHTNDAATWASLRAEKIRRGEEYIAFPRCWNRFSEDTCASSVGFSSRSNSFIEVDGLRFVQFFGTYSPGYYIHIAWDKDNQIHLLIPSGPGWWDPIRETIERKTFYIQRAENQYNYKDKGQRRNPDETLRELERRAYSGDQEAGAKLIAHRKRAGLRPFKRGEIVYVEEAIREWSPTSGRAYLFAIAFSRPYGSSPEPLPNECLGYYIYPRFNNQCAIVGWNTGSFCDISDIKAIVAFSRLPISSQEEIDITSILSEQWRSLVQKSKLRKNPDENLRDLERRAQLDPSLLPQLQNARQRAGLCPQCADPLDDDFGLCIRCHPPRLTWDTSEIYSNLVERLVEDENMTQAEAEHEAATDQFYYQMEWDELIRELTVWIEKVNPNRRDWCVAGHNMGWMRRTGFKRVPFRDISRHSQRNDPLGAQLLRQILPDTECTFTITYQVDGFHISNSHHDGSESYDITLAFACKYCGEEFCDQEEADKHCFQCPKCEALYDTAEQAIQCCKEIYECSCGKQYESQAEANACCENKLARRNPDDELRQLEKIAAATRSKQDLKKLYRACVRAGVPMPIPMHEHNCKDCVFLGSDSAQTFWSRDLSTHYDFYFCKGPASSLGGSFIWRYGDEDYQYGSSSATVVQELVGRGEEDTPFFSKLFELATARGLKWT